MGDRDTFTLSPLAKQKLLEIESQVKKSRSDIVSEAIIYYSTLFERKSDAATVDKTVAPPGS